MEREELADWLRLLLTPEVGRSSARKLLGAFGLPQQVFAQPMSALRELLSAAQAQALRAGPPDLAQQLQNTWLWLNAAPSAQQRRILTLADSAYPTGLLETADPPLLLFLAGQFENTWPPAIAIVGSRNPTPQGLANAKQFAAQFVGAGYAVASGLALGVDGAAHEGALEAAGAGPIATIAVVGTGLDRVYPAQHRTLTHRIATQGLLVSEYPLGTPPLAINFPRRNRIIAALAQGTLVVEAALKSGSLITARLAAEQGREVFAIPGSIHSAQSRGCHALLREGAKLVETAQDVLEELVPWAGPAPASAPPAARAVAEPARREDALTQALGFDPVGLDALVARTGMAPSDLQARLLQMELSGAVARLPGGLFQRIALA